MNPARANRIVLYSAIATFGFGFINSFSEEKRKGAAGTFPSPYHVRLFVGAGVVFIVLSALADIEPDIAAPFAVLVGTTATIVEGGSAINHVLSLTNQGDN